MNGLPGCGWLPSLRRSVIKVAFFLAVHPARPPPYSAFCAELPLLPKSIAFLRDRAIFSVRDSFCPQLFSQMFPNRGGINEGKKADGMSVHPSSARTLSAGYRISYVVVCVVLN